jgi:hypothetical protein
MIAILFILSLCLAHGIVGAFISPTVPSAGFPRSTERRGQHLDDGDVDVDGFVTDDQSHIGTFNRRQITSAAVGLIAAILYNACIANADEPSNMYFKSKSDGEEDPLVVFDRSLEEMNSNDSASSKPKGSLSFGDISLPAESSVEFSPSSAVGDLGSTIERKKDSQKRRIDPRTHG